MRTADNLNASIVNIYIWNEKKGRAICAGCGVIADSRLGIIISGGLVLQRLRHLLRYNKKRKIIKSGQNPFVPIVEAVHTNKCSISSSTKSLSTKRTRRYYTAEILAHCVGKNIDICTLRMVNSFHIVDNGMSDNVGRGEDTSRLPLFKKVTRIDKMTSKPSQSLLSVFNIRRCDRNLPHQTVKPNDVQERANYTLKPITKNELRRFCEISLSSKNIIPQLHEDPEGLRVVGCHQPATFTTIEVNEVGGLKQAHPTHARAERKHHHSKSSHSCCKERDQYCSVVMNTRYPLDRRVIGTPCLNRQNELIGIVGNSVLEEDYKGMCHLVSWSYSVAGTDVIKWTLKFSRKKCKSDELKSGQTCSLSA